MTKETDEKEKWECKEHDQKEWYCIKDEDGYEFHCKKYEWPFNTPNKFSDETIARSMYYIPKDKKPSQSLER